MTCRITRASATSPTSRTGIDCVNCHGQVNTMEVIQVVKPFNMGWCVNCHRQPEYNAPIDCVTCLLLMTTTLNAVGTRTQACIPKPART